MKLKYKLISVLAALCLLGSTACFSAVAAEYLNRQSGDEEIADGGDAGYTDPTPIEDPGYTDPVTPDPGYTEPDPVDPGYTDPVTSDPGYEEPDPVDPGYDDPGYSEPTYSATYSDVISEGNFPQPIYSEPVQSTPSAYVDDTQQQYLNDQQYNQYIYYTQQQQYDDNYIYVPEYTEPTESLISTSSKQIDTDELSSDDWQSIILDLERGGADDTNGAQTFAFIKDNEEEGDTDMMWMVYLGTGLIILAVLMVVFVIVSTTKANAKETEYYYA